MDAVSGATYTSGGYLSFLQAALTPHTFDDYQDTSGYVTSGQRSPCRRSRPAAAAGRGAAPHRWTWRCSHWPAPVGPSWSHHRALLVHGLDQPQPFVPSYFDLKNPLG